MPDDPHKADPLDFVLWQAGAPSEPAWDNPWGQSRPGWHIECTAMATHYLGDQIDIHGGGRDLIFPHHPPRSLRPSPYSGKPPFVRFLDHGGMAFLGGEKMSKSLGNMVFIRDALNEHSADALRWYLLSFPYRDDFHYERAGVVAAEAQVGRLRDALRGRWLRLRARPSKAQAAFFAALDDDLRLPEALAQLDRLAGDTLTARRRRAGMAGAQAALRAMAGVFGFWVAAEQAPAG